MNQTSRLRITLTTMLLLASGCYAGAPALDGDTGPGSSTGGTTAMTATAGDGPTDAGPSIDEYILGLGQLTIPPEEPTMQEQCEMDCIQDTEECVYTYYHATEHFGEFVAFQPNSATLWPGVIVKGGDAQFGLLTPISLERAPLTFSFSLENLVASPVAVMEKPALSAFRALRNTILQQGVEGHAPASMNLEVSQVTSADSLTRLFKTDVAWGKENGNKVTSMFDFLAEDSGYQLAVDFSQAYYTVDIDTPAAPSDLFAPAVTLEDVQKFMGVENPPMYVQSITFGRRSVVSIKTKHSLDRVKTAFSAAIKSVVDVDATVDAATMHLLDTLDMKVFVLGGSGAGAVQAISGFTGLIEYIEGGAEYSAESPGAPIAYKLAYLDNTGTKFAYTTDFAEASCTPKLTAVVTGATLTIDKNGEGSGGAELKYEAKVYDDQGNTCTLLLNHDFAIDHDDGTVLPINKDCQFEFASDQPGSLTIAIWAQEQGGGLDSTKQTANTASYVYDPQQLTWQPAISGQSLELAASNSSGKGKELKVTLDYSINLR